MYTMFIKIMTQFFVNKGRKGKAMLLLPIGNLLKYCIANYYYCNLKSE